MRIKNLRKIEEPIKDSKKVIAGLKGQIGKLRNQLIIAKERIELKEVEIKSLNDFNNEVVSVSNDLIEEKTKLETNLKVAYDDFDKVRINYSNEREGLINKISKLEHENIQLIQESKHKSFSIIKWLFNTK